MKRLIVVTLIAGLILAGTLPVIAQDGGGRPPLEPDNAAQMRTVTTLSAPFDLSGDGRLVAMAGGENTLIVKELATGKTLYSLDEPETGPQRLRLSPDGHWLAACREESVSLWDLTTGQAVSTWEIPAWGFSCIFSPDSRLLATPGDQTLVVLWDPATGQPVITSPPPRESATVSELAFSHDGTRLAAVTNSGLYLWNVIPGSPTLAPPKRYGGSGAWNIAFSPDSQFLSAQEDGSAQLWTPDEVMPERADCVAFSPDGKWIAYSPMLHTIEIVSTTDRFSMTFLTVPDYVWGLAFSPDSRWLASGGYENVVRLWDVTTHQQVWDAASSPHREPGTLPTGAPGDSLAFSPDGSLLMAFGTMNSAVDLWDAATGAPVHQLQGVGSDYAWFSPDGSLLFTSGDSGVLVWGIPTADMAAANPIGSMTGTASDDLWAYAGDGYNCGIAYGETLLAVGYAPDSSLIRVYASGKGCEGPVWLPAAESSSVAWTSPTGAAVMELPAVAAPAHPGNPPLEDLPGASSLCATDRQSERPADGPPYHVFTDPANRIGWFPVGLRSTTPQNTSVLICESYVDTVVETCTYEEGHALVRIRVDTVVKLINTQTRGVFGQQTFAGEYPEACPASRGFGYPTEESRGDPVQIDQWAAWALGVVSGSTPGRTVVASGSANARSEPNTQAEVVSQVAYDTPVSLIGRNEAGDWVAVLLPDMSKAWIYTSLLAVAPQTDLAALPVVSGPAADVPVPQ